MSRSTPNPSERLINLMSSAVSAGAEDAMRLARSLREGRIDVEDIQRWYDQRRNQSVEVMRQIGDELRLLQREGPGRYISLSSGKRSRGSNAPLRRAASRSRRRSRRLAASRRRSTSSSRRQNTFSRRAARSARRTARAAGRGTRRVVNRGLRRAAGVEVRAVSRSRR